MPNYIMQRNSQMCSFDRLMLAAMIFIATMATQTQGVSFGQTGYEGRAEAEAKAANKLIQGSKQEQGSATASDADSSENAAPPETTGGDYPLSFTMEMLSGEKKSLADYRGKPLLIVNTASKCGRTPQYKDLQKLHQKYSAKGLNVVGFPCNQFRGQEPGSSADIRQFCEENYGVSFDMFAKVDVKGEEQCDLYEYLTQQESSPKSAGAVSWNFEKFLVDGEGKVVARYASRVKPTSQRVVQAIEKLLSTGSDDAPQPE